MGRQKPNITGTKISAGEMPFNTLLKKFKQKVEDSGKLEEMRERMFFEKPTSERKRKKGAARARWLKKIKSQELPKRLF
jgi:small subunit ribosomal protein S21